ncbi:MAG: glycosyltransferase family 39 protein, partial [Elusimicrobiota bacterium]|nr:glycosyltransferase family 39 protein [Elusimicrobiota bacterium]
MAEEKNEKIRALTWKEKFYASRAVFESIMFEKELSAPKKDNKWPGLLGLSAIILIGISFLAMWLLRQEYVFSLQDAINVNIITAFMENLSSGNWMVIFSPETIGIKNLQPPLYFLTYYPFLQLFPDNLNFAILGVNSFYLAILAFSVYSLASFKRTYKSGWLAAAVVISMPFVLEVLRRPTPEIATMAFAALAYAGFVNSEEFEKDGRWGLVYGLAVAFGLFTDKFFIIYILPTLLTFISTLLSPIARGRVIWGFIIAAALNIPWYIRNMFYVFVTESFSGLETVYFKSFAFKNLFWYLGSAITASHLLLFIMGAFALIWMYNAVFMPYEGKATVFMWFLIPYIIFTFLFTNNPANMYPAVITLAIAIGVMTPDKIRNYFFGVLAFLFIVNQTGMINTKAISVFGGNIPFIGLSAPLNATSKLPDMIELIKERSGDKSLARVSVIGKDDSFNIPSFSLYVKKKG